MGNNARDGKSPGDEMSESLATERNLRVAASLHGRCALWNLEILSCSNPLPVNYKMTDRQDFPGSAWLTDG